MAAAVFIGALSCPASTLAARTTPEQAVAQLNALRAHNGIPGNLVLDPRLSDGCDKHNRYQQLNSPGALAHGELESRPGWTPEGDFRNFDSAMTGEVLAFANPTISSWGGLWGSPWGFTPWAEKTFSAPIHMMLMLRPEAVSAGYAESYGRACMRLADPPLPPPAPGQSFPDRTQTFSVPGNGVTDVPTAVDVGEAPYSPDEVAGLEGPVGFNILLWHPRPSLVASARLVGPNGEHPTRIVDGRSKVPGSDDPIQIDGAIIVPEFPLTGSSDYTLDVVFTDGQPYRLGFRTEPWSRPMPIKTRVTNASVIVTAVGATLQDPEGRNMRAHGGNGIFRAVGGGTYRACANEWGNSRCKSLVLKAFQRISLRRSGRRLTVRAERAHGDARRATIRFRDCRGRELGRAVVSLNGTKTLAAPSGTKQVLLAAGAGRHWRAVDIYAGTCRVGG